MANTMAAHGRVENVAQPGTLSLRAPYLVFVGSETNSKFAKTAFGVVDWRGDACLGQLRLPGCKVDLGLPDMSLDEAVKAGAKSLVIGVASVGGRIDDAWTEVLVNAARLGLDVVGGLHTRLNDHDVLAAAARVSGSALIDLRTPPKNLPVGNGRKRSGMRALTVGTDCAVGKKYTALALWRALSAEGMDCDFRASGQTGILISGQGIPIDSVVCDFTSGAAEMLSPDAAPDHWDLIEGQGSLFHPGYAGVSLGLLHGSQPDAVIVCHEQGRTRINRYEAFPMPDLATCMERNLEAARLVNPGVVCAGVSINTSHMTTAERSAYLSGLEAELDLPCVDPVSTGIEPIAAVLRAMTPS